MNAKALPVLMYHHVSPQQGLVTVAPAVFRAQMQYLAEHDYHSISCTELADFYSGKPLPKKSVLITFDDGFLDNYVYAYPILREFSLHAALFIVTGWLSDGKARAYAGQGNVLPDTPNHRQCMQAIRNGMADQVMLRWSELEEMKNTGIFEFHSHTHTHTRWDQHIADSTQRQTALLNDLAESRRTLESRLGTASPHLCWPQGYFDENSIKTAQHAGFTYLYTVQKGLNTPHSSAQIIQRMVVKDKAGSWFSSRLWLYQRPLLGCAYLCLRGQ